ncbi:ATP-binding cassette domain-containing protein [Rhodococcus opacus]|nr:ATP-binding cassette domain-containing protein [Rhodococcus opacus]
METEQPGLVLSKITKTFPGVTALDEVDFECRPGEVHALVGENGSGKSTLIKVAAGVLKPDTGVVRIGGNPLHLANPREARRLGLSTAYQDTSLVNELTVAQNIKLSFHGVDGPAPEDITKLLQRFDAPFRPTDPVKSLGPGGRQLLEVIRALSHSPRVLVLDEPTAALDMGTAAQLQDWIRHARDEGVAVIYVSHRLEEVRRLANRLTVIRDGVIRGTHERMDWDVDEIVELMVGARVDLEFPHRAPMSESADSRLEAKDLEGPGVGPVSLHVRRGEVVGIAGAEGNGQRQLLRAIIGAERTTGTVTVDGTTRRPSGPTAALRAGIMFQSGDRAAESVFPSLSVLDNSTFQLTRPSGPAGLALRRNLLSHFQSTVKRLGIVTASPYQPISALSGGNQQKIVLSRPLLSRPKVLILDEPTQGVDAKARLDIYRTVSEAAESGVSVLVNSSDSSELAGLCDRVYVMSDGAVIDEVSDNLNEADLVRRFVSTTEKRDSKKADGIGRLGGAFRFAASPQIPVIVLLLLIAAVGVYAQSQNGAFLSTGNVGNMALTALPLLCAALGQQFALLTGGFDISIGASMTVSVVAASFLLGSIGTGSILLTVLVTVGIGIAVGLFNALLTVIFKINALVATIGTLGILTGLAVFLRPEPGGLIATDLGLYLLEGVGALPYCFIAVLLIAVALDVWLTRSGTGLSARAVGLETEPSQRIGLRVTRIKTVAYILTAIGATVGGLFLATQIGTGSNDAALGFALPTFAACFLGGATLSGGRGTYVGASLGVVLLTMIGSAASLLGHTYAISQIIYGVILLVAVVSYAFAERRASRG